MKLVNVQGRKKTGKTTTVTNIISELVRRGYTVGSVKGIHIDAFSMDSETADTGKHKRAGADPVTARCHDETNVMFKGKRNLREILKFYDTDWVVIESHVDLRCPNIITGRTAYYDGEGKDVSLDEQVNELTIACSGVISNEISEFEGLPVINSMTSIEKLVDVIENYYNCKEEVRILEPEEEMALIESNDFIKVHADGREEAGSDHMLMENTVEVYINGKLRGAVPCTPQNIPELVIGWLNAEGFIDDIREIQQITINDEGTLAEVLLDNEWGNYPVRPVSQVKWKKEWIFALAKDFEIIMPLRQETMAAHNCRIARGLDDGSIDILFKCEDIGRNSAIDKVIGWSIRNGIDMTDCIMVTSGRVSRAMVQKVIRAGIPVMAGKGTISKKAVALAKANNLTLIGYAKADSLCIFA